MKTAPLISLCLVATLLAGDPPPAVTKDTVSTFYRQFKRVTKDPHYVAPLTATLCMAPGPELVEREKRMTGLHHRTSVHIYANPPAEDVIKVNTGVFPAGAVIVKEKLAADGSVTGVGGMIKRAPGFDAKNGDWEYFYSDSAAGFSIGKLQNCADCHANAKAADYVFYGWKNFRLPRQPPPKN